MTKDERTLLEEKYWGKRSAAYEEDRERLALGEPLAYVIGWQPFLGLKIYLDSKPLIPRPETEWWTELALHEAQRRSFEDVSQRDGARHSKFSAENYARPRADAAVPLTFLDLCSGSGAIGCAALAQLPQARVFFGEIDEAHRDTILKNIRKNGLDQSRADVRIGDLLEPFASLKFDIIAANPPYIPSGRALSPSVSAHEPKGALYAGGDGLAVIRRIARELPRYLAPGGMTWIECDSEYAETAGSLFASQGLQFEIRTDQYGRPRIIRVTL
ncbi:peptide chain release factor N(5)-glutamine methyltransferase [Candidatus Kaiserbacteria bacterium]|nr:peptide chain release factor N(5)-glutamine methyltransferase [Candidatus Kaiserbacteria bacterium]